MLTTFGLTALTFTLLMWGLQVRGPGFVLAFALGCVLASAYGFMAGVWPLGAMEAVWALLALRRYRNVARDSGPGSASA